MKKGDPDFAIVNHRVYDSFGRLESGPNSAVDSGFGFTGGFTDPDTGYTHLLRRWYDLSTGRRLSEHPIGFAAGGANLTRYVGNRPLLFVDPTGWLGEGVTVRGGMGSLTVSRRRTRRCGRRHTRTGTPAAHGETT